MDRNEYDLLIEEEQQLGPSNVVNEYDELIAQEQGMQKAQVQEVVRVQSEKDPARAAEVYNIAKETGLPSTAVDRNLDKIKKRKKLDTFNYDELLKVNPGLAKWISDPDHAAVAHSEIEPLKKIEQNAIKIRANRKEPGFLPSIVNAGETGWNGLVSSGAFLAAAYGRVDAETASNLIAGAQLKSQRGQERKPEFAREFDEELGSDVDDVDRRFSQFTGSFGELREGNILKALKDFAVGGTMTVAETLELIGSAAIRPRGLIYSNVESLANSIPSLVTGAAGAQAGAAAGSVVPGLGTAIGGAVGFGVGSFFGSAPTEIGASIAQDLTERGYDLTDPSQVQAALNNKELMQEIVSRAERKGITTATVDGLFNTVAGRLLAGSRGVSLGSRVKAGAQDVARDAVGEGLGEYAGSVAREEGDFSKVSIGESILEGVISIGSSVGDVTIGALNEVRARYPRNTEQAAVEVAQDAQNAIESANEIEALNEMGAAIKEAENTSQATEAIQSLVDASMGQDGEAAAVFFQADDWDSYWSDRGESPVKKAYEISEDVGKSYAQATATGTDFEIPLAQYAEKVGKTEDFEALNQKVKTRSDGMTIEQANETIRNLPGLLKQLSEEAVRLEDQDFQDSLAEVKHRVKDQLKLTGMSDRDATLQAQLYESRVKTRAMLRGQDPLQIFKEQNLQIQRQGQLVVRDNKTYDEMMRERELQKEFNERRGIQEKSVDSLRGEARDFAESIIADEIQQMVHEIQQSEAGQRSGFEQVVDDGKGGGRKEWVSTSTQSTFPAWYGSLKVKNKDAFEKAATKGRGKVYGRIRDIAIERLKNGYDNQHSGQVMPNNDFRATIGLPLVNESGMVQDDTFDLFQNAKDPKGKISIGDGFFRIDLLAKADPSTFLHETGHLWLEEIKNDVMFVNAMSDDQLNETQLAFKEDVKSILDYLGVNSIHEIETEHHELWARSVEKYLMEGKAPTQGLSKAFARFKVWLTTVYRQLRNIDAPLTDEVRGVMDRLLATQIEIEEAKRAHHVKNITNPDMRSKVDRKRLKAYEEVLDLFDREAKEKMTKQLMQSHRREREIYLSEERKRVAKQVEDFLKNQRPYKALETIKTATDANGFPLKIDRGELVSRFGEEAVRNLPKEIYTRKGGMLADSVAFATGYRDAMEMVEELQNTPKLKDQVKSLTDKRMREKYPEGFLEGQDLQEMAERFIHSDKRSELLLLELSMLNDAEQAGLQEGLRKTARRIPTNDQIKKEAAATLSGVKVKNIRPHLYQRAEVRYARLVEEHISKGDYGQAFEAKQKELLNHQLYRQAMELKDKHQKAIKRFKRLEGKDEKLAKTRDMALVNSAREILARYGLGRNPDRSKMNLEQIKRYDPETYQMVEGIVGSIDIPDQNYRELTQEQFEEVTQAVDALWDLSKSSKEVEVGGVKMQVEEVAQKLKDRLDELSKDKTKKKEYARAKNEFEKFRDQLLWVNAKLRRNEAWTEAMDGGDPSGIFGQIFFKPVSDAVDVYENRKKEINERIVEMADELVGEIPGDKIFSKELGYEFKNKGEILGALLHTGNEGNLKKLLIGRGWGTLNEDKTLNTKKWDAFLQDMHQREIITKKDWDFIQGLWDMMEEIKPEVQKAHRKLYGHYFEEVQATQVETPFGTYRGGYAPAKVDTDLVRERGRQNEIDELTSDNPVFQMLPGTGGNGFSKSRVENYNRPLSLDIGLVTQHMDDVLRFAVVKPPVVDAGKVLANSTFRDAMDEFDPHIVNAMLVPALSRADKNRRGDIGMDSNNIVVRLGGVLQKRIAANYMFMNMVNIGEQFAGFFPAMTKMRPRSLMEGMKTYLADPKGVSALIDEKSLYMKNKTDDQIYKLGLRARKLFQKDPVQSFIDGAAEKGLFNKDLADSVAVHGFTKGFGKAREWFEDHTYIGQIVTQDFIDKMVWVSKYNEMMATKGVTEKQAIQAADSVVRNTQAGGARAFDVSAMQASVTLSMFQMFAGWFNSMLNLNQTNIQILLRDQGMTRSEKLKRGIFLYLNGYASVAIISAALRKAAAGGLDEEDDGRVMDDLYDVFVKSQFELGAAMVPFVGSAIVAAVNRGDNKFYNNKMSVSPMFEALTVTGDYLIPDFDGPFERANARDGLTALGVLTGVPLRPFAKPIKYMQDVSEGVAEPSGPIDFTRGLVTGYPGVSGDD